MLIAASILAARRLAQTDAKPRSPAFQAAIYDAIATAEAIMRRIDDQWPAPKESTRSAKVVAVILSFRVAHDNE